MRIVLAVMAGYAAMFVGVFTMFTLAYRVLKADGAFEPGTYEVSLVWLVLMFIVGFVAAVVGGIVAARIGASAKAPTILAGIVLALGLAMGFFTVTSEEWKTPSPPRLGEVANAEAMNNAKQPALVLFLNPIIGAAGVMVGARLLTERTRG